MIRALLCDIEGTLWHDGEWFPGVVDTLTTIIQKGVPIRFLTNTTMRARAQFVEAFRMQDLPVEEDSFLTPASVARSYFLKKNTIDGIFPLIHSNLLPDLEGLHLTYDEHAGAVLVGDMGDEWNLELLHNALRALFRGAEFWALQKNRYWLAREGYRLDAGAFVAALEYASGRTCQGVFGKPSRVFFHIAIQHIGLPPHEIAIIGDDIESDIRAGIQFGLKGFLVRTGKFRPELLQESDAHTFHVLDNFCEIVQYF